ncbi:hypothetical protein BGZ70_001583 [Mortierella alpina]|uniref:Uncharacterized protein n=1 Tax=Mortierella alpina TaxID=64518 RepID=A0A9P6JBV4_MORAP|nr:hypothetical protein BGZ70_001583 [Mortierella alpina]
MDKDSFEAAMRIIRLALQDRINHTAQTALANDILCTAVGLRSASLVDQLLLSENDIARIESIFHHSSRFNQLDLLSIGQDHVFVIHRELLLQDIYDFLSYSPKGLQRVFVNVDYRLPQPEIIPGNRYKPLEDYLREVLLPEIKHRIATWDQAECVSRPLDISAALSMVTLVGWLSSYPVNYVHPTRERSDKRKLEAGDNNDNNDDNDDDDQDCGRNCLANQLLVLTSVQLEPSETINGLKDHLMMSFSYPAELAERFMDRSLLSPESPCSPSEPSESCWPGTKASKNVRAGGGGSEGQVDAGDNDDDEDDDGQEFVDASDAEFTEPEGDPEENPSTLGTSGQESAMSSSSENPSSPLKISVTSAATTATVPTTLSATSPTTTTTTTTATTDTICLPDCHPDCMPGSLAEATTTTTLQTQFNPQSQPPPQPQPNSSRPRSLQGRPRSHTYAHPEKPVVSRPRSRRLPSSASYDQNKPLPFNNPDILAAGRSFLHQLHTRFQKQTVWKAWEVGQEKVTLPVVAM